MDTIIINITNRLEDAGYEYVGNPEIGSMQYNHPTLPSLSVIIHAYCTQIEVLWLLNNDIQDYEVHSL